MVQADTIEELAVKMGVPPETLRQEIWQERLKAWIKKIKDEAYYRVYLPNE